MSKPDEPQEEEDQETQAEATDSTSWRETQPPKLSSRLAT
jgi:hypothetical protein